MQVIKDKDGRYYKPCPECNKQQSYLRKNYAEHSLRLNKLCKSCSNKKIDNCHRGWHRGIRVSWFNKFKICAETRGKDWNLSIDEVADVMEAQKNKCALTGWSIEFPESGHPQEAPASIDRIDSALGYFKDNVQLVTREVNMMKQHYTQDEFMKVCKAVANKTKW